MESLLGLRARELRARSNHGVREGPKSVKGKGARRMTRGGILAAELATLLPFFLDRFSPQAKREILALGIA